MPAGRPPKGPDLVDGLEGSAEARRRLKLVLETIQGERTVAEAVAMLGISESRFHAIRENALAGALETLEPLPRGRPPGAPDPEAVHVSEIQALVDEIMELEEALEMEKTRNDVNRIMALPEGGEKKISPDRGERRKKRKAQRQNRKKGRAD